MMTTGVLVTAMSVGLLETFASLEFSQIIIVSLSSVSVMVSIDLIFLALLVDST
jgi:hypothetical protein